MGYPILTVVFWLVFSLFFFSFNFNRIFCMQIMKCDQAPRPGASLGMHCLPVSYIMDIRFIRLKFPPSLVKILKYLLDTLRT